MMNSDPAAPPSSSMSHAVQRHRDIMQDYNRDFNRTKVRPNVLSYAFRPLNVVKRPTPKPRSTKRTYWITSGATSSQYLLHTHSILPHAEPN